MSVAAPAAVVLVGALAQEISRRIQERPRTILYLSRNDLEPGRALEATFPGARVTCWTKADFQGRSAFSSWRQLRRGHYDLFVLHDRTTYFRRLSDLYRLVALSVNAKRRFLVSADLQRGAVVGTWTIENVAPFRTFPAIAGRLALELAALGPLLLLSPARFRVRRPPKRTNFEAGKKYQVAYLRTDYSFDIRAGGSVSHIAGVAQGLEAAGHSVYFISSDHLSDLDSERMPVHVVPTGEEIRVFDEGAMIAYHYRFVKEASRIIARNRPDILYQRHSVFNAAGACLSRRFGIPLILEANHSEVHARIMWSRLHLKSLAEQMEAYAFANADAIVAVSNIGRDQLVRFGADPEKVLINPNGVDPGRFRPDIDGDFVRRQLGFGPDEVVCGFLGTFTRWHGVLFLAESVPDLVQRHGQVRFLFMGDGDLRSAVEDKIERSGTSRACVFTGLIEHRFVPAHLAACDVLLSPHLPFEDGTPFFGSPTKLFEYMAMGRAVVASNLGQIGEVIEDGESGLLFEPGNRNEFVEQMSRLIEDRELRLKLGVGGRRRVIESFTWERNVERVLGFLESRLGGGRTTE